MTLSSAFLALALGCSSTRTSGSPDFPLQVGETFAWSPSTSADRTFDGDVPWGELRDTVAAELRERGLQEVAGQEADITVDMDIAIQVLTRQNDPEFYLYVGERFERATLSVELQRNAEQGAYWRGECRHDLRDVARTIGGITGAAWQPIEQERSWPVQALVDRIFDRLPQSSNGD